MDTMCISVTRIHARKLLCAVLLVAIAWAQGSSGRDLTMANVGRQLLSRGNERGNKRPTGAGVPELDDDHPEPNSTFPGRPEFNGTRPEFSGTHPDFNGTRPEFNGKHPEFNGTRPEFNETRPDCNGTVLVNATRPLARPPSAGRGGYGKGKGRDLLSKDGDHGRSGSYGPKAERDDDEEEEDNNEDEDEWAEHNSTFLGRPEFNSTYHDFNETHPEFNGTHPEFNGTRPEFNGTRPEFNGTRPEFNGKHPEFNGTRPEFNGTRPEFNETRPEFNGTALVNATRPLARPPSAGRGGHGKEGKRHGRRLLRQTGTLI
ncbi:hypothetical protein VaNZ11_005159 [Volvox africanus]|uniref:Uncharacterized protein n=1 Tax=Volvox africanus TaxID=51714 RepID=A0ABQ5RZ82_9CHLO|nr:hypothetical protein VaNZ11_005159 [Volvox africanus]